MFPTLRRSATTALLFAVAACGGGDGGTNPPVNVGGFTVSLSSTTLSVQQGGSGSVTATIARTGSFTGTVNLSTENVPAGITAAFNPAAIATSTTSTTLTVDVAASVAPGSYTFTIRGQASGVSAQQTATVSMTVTPRPSIALALAPTSASVAQGGSTSFTATVTPTNFAGATTVAVTGAPTGVTTAVTTNGNVHTVAVTVAATTTPGAYTLTATASGTGVTSAAATFALTVTATSGGSIALSVTQNPVSVQQGNSGNTTVNIARTNFAAPVNLALSGVPANVTATLGSTSTAGNSTTLTLAAAANAPVGSHTITITGTGTGITAATTTVTLQINAASGGTSVTAQFCGTASADIPIWFAAQDGNGAWSRITAGTNNTYTFTINSATGAVAYVKQEATDDFTLTLIHGARAELIISDLCGAPPVGGTKMVTGTLAGVGATDVVSVQFGGATAAPTMLNPNFSLNNVRDGLQDILATRAVLNLTPPIGFFVNKLFLKRNLNPANGGSIGTVDFNGSDAFDPDQKTATLSGVGVGESTSVATFFATANSAATVLGLPLTGSSTTVNYIGVPAARVIAGDFHMFTASAQTFTGSTITAFRTSTAVEQNASNLTLSFGAVLPQPTVTSTNGGYARIRTVVGRPSDYDLFWTMVHDQSAANRRVNISLLPGYFSNVATLDVSVPDFSGVAGWQDTWGPRPGAATSWTIHGAGSTVGNGQTIIGARSRTAQRNGSFTP